MSRFKIKVLLLLLYFSYCSNSYSVEGDNTLKLISREYVQDYVPFEIKLTPSQKYWLHNKKTITLAVSLPDNPPMDITLRADLYEGVTADVIGLIEKKLGVRIVVKTFQAREAAISAVKDGRADLIGSSNNYELEQGLLLTKNYINVLPALYKNLSTKTKNIKKIAVYQHYLPFAEIVNAFPGASVDLYPSRYSAVAAVAYEKADAVLIDMISGNFLINKFHQDGIQLVGSVPINITGFAFGVTPSDSILKDILNIAVTSIPQENISSIIKRWNGGGLSVQPEAAVLTETEKQWLSNKKIIKIALNKGLPPLSFIDIHGNVHGIAADLIQVIGARLGVQFEVVPVTSTVEQISALDRGSVDLMIMTPSKKRREKYSFSHAFALEPLVYVVNAKNSSVGPDKLIANGRLAVIDGFVVTLETDKVTQRAKNSQLFKKIESALDCIAEDICDIAVLPSRVAKYFVHTYYQDSLVISGELFESVPISANFASLHSQKILVDILSKVILSIPPGELDSLSTRWRVSAKKELITWQDLLREFKGEVAFILFFVLAAGVWGISLRRQIIRRIQAESDLRTQLKFIEELVDSTPNPIYALDKMGRIVLCNKPYAKFFNLDKLSLIGVSIKNLIKHSSFIEPLVQAFHHTIKSGAPIDGDYHLQRHDGVVDIYHWLQVYRDLQGNIQGVVGGWIDISERISLMRELASASRNAQDASRAKSTFLATMSHEIRTPMNAIIGLLELTLRKGGLNESDRESISIAYHSSRDLLSLIGDILDISKIESGKLELIPSPNSIVELSNSVINVFSAIARQKGLNLILTYQQDINVMVDPVRYKQILSNLVSNAIKFTRNGGVEVEILINQEDQWCNVTLKVTDSGIGINKQDLGLLFRPFSQAGQPADIQRSGSGLGLMISRSLSQMMGGDLNISSEPGQGTRVVVSLKLLLVDSQMYLGTQIADEPVFLKGQRGLQVLIIDDHPTNRLLVNQQLAFLGHDVSTAESGNRALQLLDTQFFDIIITDFNMPDVDGFEFTTRYRQREQDEGRERAIIIGLTADARQEQIQKAVEAGMDDCLFKPVSLDELNICLATHYINQVIIPPEKMAARFTDRLNALTSGNQQLMNSLLSEFIRASDEDMQALIEACRVADGQIFVARLHRLKGGARILGADELVACCSDWEKSSRLPLCMPSALRQVDKIYQQVKAGVSYWVQHHKYN
ncbi:ATP-binding protein [Aeromonas veronii]|uniref:ATP-binding protein n=1 Tax=Aeromonas veronii TaxID=654 RepID=UPI002B4709A0|nr:transporter substrate-binding domain-containing protein [Aeromonas veronii]